MAKAVIFDRDGVLVDSEPVNIASVALALKGLGVTITEADEKQIVARHPADYQGYFLAKYRIPQEEFRKERSRSYYALFGKAPLFEGTVALVRELKAKGVPLALATSGNRPTTDTFLSRTHLSFDAIVTFEDCTRRKPDPEVYLIAAERLGVPPKGCTVVEDSAVGLAAAKAAGMRCIVLPNAYTKDQDFSAADAVARDAEELRRLLGL